jgi:hypothetical protein
MKYANEQEHQKFMQIQAKIRWRLSQIEEKIGARLKSKPQDKDCLKMLEWAEKIHDQIDLLYRD